ncbi:Sbal_3080 family lipoprotein [Teredinibacter turnerae]|uniref:Sbal_3080 family lipoprotein n=1 Tax=Teredinibacter turnerae TaxID=2426 RepID=UPI00037C0F95|nr:Sbal_3080 family lipoprotein [Teredinibacter turnerae]
MKKIAFIFIFLLCTSCTITRNVEPVQGQIRVDKIYVKDNPDVHMEGLVDEIVSQLNTLGFQSSKYSESKPIDAVYHLEYTANWAWDMAMYLTFFDAKLYENDKVIGSVLYDARAGGGNMGKFGPTAEKIEPLLRELLQNAQPQG